MSTIGDGKHFCPPTKVARTTLKSRRPV